jgi:hypothetical protein
MGALLATLAPVSNSFTSSFGEIEPFPYIALERLERSDSAVGKIVAIGQGMALIGQSGSR